jgi:hypothetical protein
MNDNMRDNQRLDLRRFYWESNVKTLGLSRECDLIAEFHDISFLYMCLTSRYYVNHGQSLLGARTEKARMSYLTMLFYWM